MNKPSSAVKIQCPACGQESWLKRAPRYEGFTKVGETLSCLACGHIFASEAEAPRHRKKGLVGLERNDLPPLPKVFAAAEAARLCRHCRHYIVNPFIQRCARQNREVEATDTCDRFEAKEEEEESGVAGQ